MEIRQLQTFAVVAELLSFRGAAARLGVAQSGVTAQIQALEQSLDVRLFERLGRQVSLTGAGARLLEFVPRLTGLYEETRLAVSGAGERQALLRIGAPELLCNTRLLPAIRAFREAHPDVRLQFAGGTYDSLVADLEAGRHDVAFVIGDPVAEPALRGGMLWREPVVLVCAPDYPVGPVVDEAALAGHVLLLSEEGCGFRRRFERAMGEAGVRLTRTTTFTSVETIRRMAAAGIGIGLAPLVAVEQDIATGGLRRLDWRGGPLDVQSQLLWHKDKWKSPLLTAFEQAVRATAPPAAARKRR
jgi:DNA-binding transcriptional LysR family regulator